MSAVLGTFKGRGIAGSAQYGMSSQGNEQIAVDIQLLDGDAAGNVVTTALSFAENAAKYAIERLRALGWTGNDLSNLVGIDANEVQVRVFEDEYNGKVTVKAEIVTGAGRFEFKDKMSDVQRRNFAARFKGLASGAAVAPAAQPNRAQAHPQHRTTSARRPDLATAREQAFGGPSTPGDDEIPF